MVCRGSRTPLRKHNNHKHCLLLWMQIQWKLLGYLQTNRSPLNLEWLARMMILRSLRVIETNARSKRKFIILMNVRSERQFNWMMMPRTSNDMNQSLQTKRAIKASLVNLERHGISAVEASEFAKWILNAHIFRITLRETAQKARFECFRVITKQQKKTNGCHDGLKQRLVGGGHPTSVQMQPSW